MIQGTRLKTLWVLSIKLSKLACLVQIKTSMLLYKSQGYRNFLVKYDRDSLSWILQNWLQDSFETDGFKQKRATGVASEN